MFLACASHYGIPVLELVRGADYAVRLLPAARRAGLVGGTQTILPTHVHPAAHAAARFGTSRLGPRIAALVAAMLVCWAVSYATGRLSPTATA
ncbi:hypothetical protein C6N75_02920 [Streptomyces solincola]|uniref:Uncharacterized protein n=1 Tax=Streptomyces solincola TaxID=2100817 RepID=A0A2S9Q1W1_9ACTN|nr:hypothetical protein [Streptomyces solincola]PRH80646.1 hypothetical protein C6N75_02920 [Streptomyces solincola]